MDLETAKTSRLCKWVVKTMELGESNLQGIDSLGLTPKEAEVGG